jgi:hypothetical protein
VRLVAPPAGAVLVLFLAPPPPGSVVPVGVLGPPAGPVVLVFLEVPSPAARAVLLVLWQPGPLHALAFTAGGRDFGKPFTVHDRDRGEEVGGEDRGTGRTFHILTEQVLGNPQRSPAVGAGSGVIHGTLPKEHLTGRAIDRPRVGVGVASSSIRCTGPRTASNLSTSKHLLLIRRRRRGIVGPHVVFSGRSQFSGRLLLQVGERCTGRV